MKNGENYKSRRNFIKGISAFSILTIIPQFVVSCKEKVLNYVFKLSGTNHILGHRLWLKNFPKPSITIEVPYLIIGGGITGLSAARQLSKKGIKDFLLIELESNLGGNASNGENVYSKFPLAAHYLPLPNVRDKELLQFLEESKIILDYKENLPVFDEEQLCSDPNERLFIKNDWQKNLIPKLGISDKKDIQIELFLDKMNDFRLQKGVDNKYFFDIPIAFSSKDLSLHYLDSITMKEWMEKQNFDAEELFEYVNYCCRDDFGLGLEFVSAWAGIYYFASRKHDHKMYDDSVLTWPEGNGRLTHHLKKYAEGKTLNNHLVFDIQINNNNTTAFVFNEKVNETIEIKSQKIIVATPQYINKYLFKSRKEIYDKFNYAPWFTATLVVNDLEDNGSFPLCWDNVIYKGKGLGYVYNQHQNLEQIIDKKVITYYYSFSSNDCKKDRSFLLKQTDEYFKNLVISDLKIAHSDIEKYIESIEIHRMGHGMISPIPGFLKGKEIKEASKSIDNKIYFSHSDLSGISIFEEAFHQGINVVNQIVDEPTLDT